MAAEVFVGECGFSGVTDRVCVEDGAGGGCCLLPLVVVVESDSSKLGLVTDTPGWD